MRRIQVRSCHHSGEQYNYDRHVNRGLSGGIRRRYSKFGGLLVRLFLITSFSDIIIKNCAVPATEQVTTSTMRWPPPNTCLNGTAAANFLHIYLLILTFHLDWFPFHSFLELDWNMHASNPSTSFSNKLTYLWLITADTMFDPVANKTQPQRSL